MNNRLPPWLWRWLSLPGWQVLATQWLGLSALALVGAGWLLQDEWRQREQAAAQRQRLALQIAQRERQLAQMPSMEATALRLQQAASRPGGQGDLTAALRLAGATLLRWQRLEKPPRQALSLRVDYAGLLTLLKTLPPALRIEHLSIEAPSQEMKVGFILQDATGDNADE
ncbi:hypothetical protein [Serratia entomophila]|uniref:hypothetical protein n=1 Tax=Serratia entomophila TaxID=42906 RepID=UPI00217C284A|nr:hypothetical protein [Serratia entomophila]CAI1957405.1 Uncharacterised protein [Serratia entomophila]